MKHIFRFNILLILIIGGFNSVYADDTPLTQIQRDFIESAYPKTIPPHNEGFDLLVGMFAAVDNDPQVEGKRWIQKVLDHYQSVYVDNISEKPKSKSKNNDDASTQANIYKDLDMTLKAALFDDFQDLCVNGCVRTLFSLSLPQRKTLLQKHDVLLQRYQTYLKTPNYINAQPYTVDAPFHYYSRLTHLHLLYLLDRIDQVATLKASNAAPLEIKNVLETMILTHKKRFLDQETLIGEMLLTANFNQTLEVAYQLAYASQILLDILPLSITELDLCPALQREAFMKSFMAGEIDVSEFVGTKQGQKYADIFLPEETKALMIDEHRAACQLSRTPLIDYDAYKLTLEKQREQFLESVKAFSFGTIDLELRSAIAKNESPEKWRNVFGRLIHAISGPKYSSYIEKNQAINSKIALINLLLKERPETLTQAWLDQQYIRFSPTFSLSNSENAQICFKLNNVVQKKLCTAFIK